MQMPDDEQKKQIKQTVVGVIQHGGHVITQKPPIVSHRNKLFYYINNYEIPSELSRENMLFSDMKRSLLLRLHIKIAPFNAFREMI